ncbi:hypothetical protein OC834_003965 [Tilletia horrida]|uniref:Uncharacterized protein n=1 Tax=Tilletia horrida TaxID=155126 RepID=A0AAN6GBP2_9BASI|nr:hypothetical protein OC842_005755 [Tilletia horrida]KAK0528706.1 hypothetical protein OC834_003965 [Tilletia horrida]
MVSPARPPASSKNVKWPSHLAVCGDLILGAAETTDCVHEVDTALYSNDGVDHSGSLNIWSREPVAQGLYLSTSVAIATHPLRLSVGDTYQIRLVPEAIDGTNTDMPALPPGMTSMIGTGAITWVAEDRKSCKVEGFTYLNKTHGWQRFQLNLFFEDTGRWTQWTFSATGSLIDFEGVVMHKDKNDVFHVAVRRVALITTAPQQLLQALDVPTAATTSQAERVRQARAAGREQARVQQAAKDDASLPQETAQVTLPVKDSAQPPKEAGDDEDGPVTPTPRKQRRLNPAI